MVEFIRATSREEQRERMDAEAPKQGGDFIRGNARVRIVWFQPGLDPAQVVQWSGPQGPPSYHGVQWFDSLAEESFSNTRHGELEGTQEPDSVLKRFDAQAVPPCVGSDLQCDRSGLIAVRSAEETTVVGPSSET